MNTLNSFIKNNDGTIDMVEANSTDNYHIAIGSNYKLVKFVNKKTFKDTFLGADIGIHSKGFMNVVVISSLIAIAVIIFMYLSFRI